MGADTVILARGLVKRFGATIALAGPDLAVGGGGAAAARDDAAPGRPGHRALDRPRRHPVGELGRRPPVVLPTAEDRAALAVAMSSDPAIDLVLGPARDLMTVDGSTAWRSGTLGSLLSGLMAVLLVARDTREDERG